jgi:hypothetical protein
MLPTIQYDDLKVGDCYALTLHNGDIVNGQFAGFAGGRGLPLIVKVVLRPGEGPVGFDRHQIKSIGKLMNR